ncbi:uncharacterized protein METZ01_LOCUS433474, partial [marine metagenome]
MDRTAIIVVSICVILLFTWQPLLEIISPTPPRPLQPTNAPPAQVAGQTNAPAAGPLGQAQPAPVSNTTTVQPPVVLESEKLVSIPTEDSIYTFTSAGGLKTVALTRHKAKPCNGNGSDNHDVILMNNGIDLLVFSLDGIDDSEFDVVADRGIVTMVSTNQAGIRITKEFRAAPNYLLHSTITLTNPKTEPLELPQRKLMLGTAMPLQAGGRYPVWGAQWHNGADMEDI